MNICAVLRYQSGTNLSLCTVKVSQQVHDIAKRKQRSTRMSLFYEEEVRGVDGGFRERIQFSF